MFDHGTLNQYFLLLSTILLVSFIYTYRLIKSIVDIMRYNQRSNELSWDLYSSRSLSFIRSYQLDLEGIFCLKSHPEQEHSLV